MEDSDVRFADNLTAIWKGCLSNRATSYPVAALRSPVPCRLSLFSVSASVSSHKHSKLSRPWISWFCGQHRNRCSGIGCLLS